MFFEFGYGIFHQVPITRYIIQIRPQIPTASTHGGAITEKLRMDVVKTVGSSITSINSEFFAVCGQPVNNIVHAVIFSDHVLLHVQAKQILNDFRQFLLQHWIIVLALLDRPLCVGQMDLEVLKLFRILLHRNLKHFIDDSPISNVNLRVKILIFKECPDDHEDHEQT